MPQRPSLTHVRTPTRQNLRDLWMGRQAFAGLHEKLENEDGFERSMRNIEIQARLQLLGQMLAQHPHQEFDSAASEPNINLRAAFQNEMRQEIRDLIESEIAQHPAASEQALRIIAYAQDRQTNS